MYVCMYVCMYNIPHVCIPQVPIHGKTPHVFHFVVQAACAPHTRETATCRVSPEANPKSRDGCRECGQAMREAERVCVQAPIWKSASGVGQKMLYFWHVKNTQMAIQTVCDQRITSIFLSLYKQRNALSNILST